MGNHKIRRLNAHVFGGATSLVFTQATWDGSARLSHKGTVRDAAWGVIVQGKRAVKRTRQVVEASEQSQLWYIDDVGYCYIWVYSLSRAI